MTTTENCKKVEPKIKNGAKQKDRKDATTTWERLKNDAMAENQELS